jgi:hypothetical protein
MLHQVNRVSYSSKDWDIMQRAHAKASELLGRCPSTHENANRLARTVMKLFDRGLRDAEVLAWIAANQETVVTNIALERRNCIASLAADSERTLEAGAGKNRIQGNSKDHV